jgi:uncharacterized protein YbaR (Trm112 family)
MNKQLLKVLYCPKCKSDLKLEITEEKDGTVKEDYYTPEFQWKQTYPEVYRWFQENDLTEIIPLSAPVSMKGRKQTIAK